MMQLMGVLVGKRSQIMALLGVLFGLAVTMGWLTPEEADKAVQAIVDFATKVGGVVISGASIWALFLSIKSARIEKALKENTAVTKSVAKVAGAAPMLLCALLLMSTCGLTGCAWSRFIADDKGVDAALEVKTSWPDWLTRWFKPKPAAPAPVPPLPTPPPAVKTVEK